MAVERRDALVVAQAYGFLDLHATQGKSSKKLQQDASTPISQETSPKPHMAAFPKNAPSGRHYSRLGGDG
jgi:hypothetical protein